MPLHIIPAPVHGPADAGAPFMLPSEPPLPPDPARTLPWVCVSVRWDDDVLAVRRRGEAVAAALGFLAGDCSVVGAAIAELARNVVRHAGWGLVLLGAEERVGRRALVVIARDKGPGICDVQRAMQDGYSSCGAYGLGLPSVQRLMDDFEIVSRPGLGTTVTAKKWMATREADDAWPAPAQYRRAPAAAARPAGIARAATTP